MQLVVFLPLSLYRNLNSLSYIVYIADLFIVLGLLYLYYYDIATIAEYGLGPDIAIFNKHDWTLFIGTAIFTFEGIGLIIPIQDGMRRPEKLPSILLIVMREVHVAVDVFQLTTRSDYQYHLHLHGGPGLCRFRFRNSYSHVSFERMLTAFTCLITGLLLSL